MAEYIENVTNADGCGDANKIKTPFAEIIVGGTVEKPYYSILYFDTTDGDFHIGWSSYCLEYVRKWFAEEFEIVGDAIDVDIAPVVYCRDCEHHDSCMAEKIYQSEGIERPYCCRGKRKEQTLPALDAGRNAPNTSIPQEVADV